MLGPCSWQATLTRGPRRTERSDICHALSKRSASKGL
jgi:hypothetical protein